MKPAGQNSFNVKVTILLFVCIVAGFNQGLLLPLLTVLLEKSGIPASMNGLNSTAMYIGSFATMFFIRKPVAVYGYRTVIAAGLLLAAAATAAFPLWESVAFWFVLRLLVGIGDSALHYATQLWIVTNSPAERRGRFISLYGMCYGIGFSIGPLGLNLLPFGNAVPFVLISAVMLLAMLCLAALPADRPGADSGVDTEKTKASTVYRIAWFALIPAFLYGCMEASLNSNFPVYGLRMGISEPEVSLLLLSVGVGSLILQLPLGAISDKIGRKPVILTCAVIGGLAFLSVPLAGRSFVGILVAFAVAGGLVGSFFSLGLAYAADRLPKQALPTANMIASIHFSVGSIAGPYIGGLGIQYVALPSAFLFLGGMFLLYAASGLIGVRQAAGAQSSGVAS
ncbi:MFS transporter [Paenibacillus thermotolerans]|uniref:MFS transporter n=1 Tax=Paenibacillus thermotolerans TaxID=3027807 RepID=UPI00236755CB|nr:MULTISPECIES: MFS transporter [unclassified Paenibacillus]